MQNWHAVEHLREAIPHFAGIKSLHAEAYKASHKRFKAVYALCLQRKSSTIYRVVAMQNIKIPKAFYMIPSLRCAEIGDTTSAREFQKSDLTVLAL